MALKIESGQLKTNRILQLFERLIQGQVINKRQAASEFQVSEKSIQRDIEDLRNYLSEWTEATGLSAIVYKERKKGYVLESERHRPFSAPEILVLLKVMLESRAFNKQELGVLVDKLIILADEQERKQIRELINNEWFHYVPVRHQQLLFDKLWELSRAIRECRVVQMKYLRVNEQQPESMRVKPLEIVFADYYFYLVIVRNDETDRLAPATLRLDRIQSYELTEDRFKMAESRRFEAGPFRQQVQFMQTGKKMKVKFKFWNKSLESILDRLPNAKVKMDGQVAVIEAEVYGKGIMMWLLSQGPHVEVLAPSEFREEMANAVKQMASLYES